MSTQTKKNFADEALSKVVVYFIDGNSRKFFSRDTSRKHRVPNRTLGISRLKKMIEGWHDNVHLAIIYNNETDEEISRFKDKKWS